MHVAMLARLVRLTRFAQRFDYALFQQRMSTKLGTHKISPSTGHLAVKLRELLVRRVLPRSATIVDPGAVGVGLAVLAQKVGDKLNAASVEDRLHDEPQHAST